MQSNASYWNFQCSLPFLSSCSSYLRLHPRLSFTLILPSIFLSVACFRRQLSRKMWSIQAAFLRSVVWCSLFVSSLTVCNDPSIITRLVHMTFSIHLQQRIENFLCNFNLLSKLYFVPVPYKAMLQTQHFICLFLRYTSNQSYQHGFPNSSSIQILIEARSLFSSIWLSTHLSISG
jgi:hypothetical protein